MQIGKLELLYEKNNSNIYKETLNENIYCLKKYRINPSCNLEMMIKSYKNYENLINKEGLVKIYDFWYDDKTVFIRMEYLEDYLPYKDWIAPGKLVIAVIIKIIKILNSLMMQGCILPDCGENNFMISKNLDVKMIDLDLINNYDIGPLLFLGKIYRTWAHRLEYSLKHKGKL